MSLAAHRTFAMTIPDDQQHDRPVKPGEAGKANADKKQDHSWQRGFANVWMVLGAAPAGLLIGYFIDRAAGTSPWWMLGLSLLFLAGSLYQLVKDSFK
jgi:F0F1-type ATP synthase assembly protein I